MYSTWLDNDHHNDAIGRRIESASKKQPANRIQVVSKINPAPNGNQHQIKHFVTQTPEYLNQTCVDRFDKMPNLRRLNTADVSATERDEQNRNILKLMQEQLELVKKAYEDKIKQQLKQSSIELSKLKIKIQNNTELLALKDQQIQQLKSQMRKGSPVKLSQQSRHQPATSPSSGLCNKINDIEIRLSSLVENQCKLGLKIQQVGMKVQLVEKGLLNILACKMANIQMKINQYADKSTMRLNNIEINIANKLKKDMMNNGLKQIKPTPMHPQHSIQSLVHWMEGLRQQVLTFKTKQFRYQNSNIFNLKKDINSLKNTVGELQKKFVSVHNRLKNSKCSSRKNFDSGKKNNSFHSNYFDDYEEVYEELDSINQDQFFHPLQQSAKRFNQNKDMSRPTHHQSRPTIHNQSFQNFTSDQQQQDTPNVKRLIKALKQGAYKLPVQIEVDLTGYIRKKIDQKYLVDTEKKGFVLTTVQLNQCKQKGLLIW